MTTKMDEIQLEDDVSITKKIKSNCLISEILAPRVHNKTGVNNIVNASWKPSRGLSISSKKPSVLIYNFDSKEYKAKVIKESPWCVMGFMLVLKHLNKGKNINELDFSTCPFWIQIHNLPLQKRSRHNIEKNSAILRTLQQIENNSIENPIIGLLTRIKVQINVIDPLKSGFKMTRENLQSIWIPFRYERLIVIVLSVAELGMRNRVINFLGQKLSKMIGMVHG